MQDHFPSADNGQEAHRLQMHGLAAMPDFNVRLLQDCPERAETAASQEKNSKTTDNTWEKAVTLLLFPILTDIVIADKGVIENAQAKTLR